LPETVDRYEQLTGSFMPLRQLAGARIRLGGLMRFEALSREK
jgi:hypothetical protein